MGDLQEERTRGRRAGFGWSVEVSRWILGTAIRLRWVAMVRRFDEARSQWAAAPTELRSALRQFRSSPAYSAAVLLTVGLGMCVAVVAGSLATGTLQPTFPYTDADRIVAVFATERDGAEFRNPVSPPDFGDWQQHSSLGDLTAARPWSPQVTIDGRRTKLIGLLATPSLFELLGASAATGRPFTADVFEEGESPVVLSSSLAARLGIGRDDVGRPLVLDGEPRVVAAIMPPDFLFPPFWMADAEIWAPLDLRAEVRAESRRGARFLRVFGRLEPDVTIEAVQAELDAWATVAERKFPATNTGVGARVERLSTPSVERSRLPLLALLGASLALLLLIEFNLALLLTARTAMRARELVVRAALGASAARIRLILLCETGLLVAIGTLLGVAAAPMVLALVHSLAEDLLPRFSSLRVDGVIVAVLLGVQGLSVLLVSRRGANSKSDGAWLNQRGLASSLASRRTWVVAEVAITAWLLLTATLLMSSFERLAREELGFDASGALSTRLDLTQVVAEDRRRSFVADLEERLAATSEIESVGLINHLPIRGDLWRTRIFAVGETPADTDIRAAYRIASAGSLEALGLRLMAGRWIDVDRAEGEPSVVINRRAANVLWPGVPVTDLLDRQVVLGSFAEEEARRRVVGVVADVKQTGVGDLVIPEVYLPLQQASPQLLGELTLIVRGAELARVQDAVLRSIQTLGSGAALFETESLEQVVAGDLLNERVQAGVSSGFALFGLMVAGFGVFALIGTVGTVRRREFAIRRVMGSTRTAVLLIVLREGAWLGCVGAALGLLAGAIGARALEPMLFDLDPLAPGIYFWCALVTVALAIFVSLPSAWRAARAPIVESIER